MSAGIRRTIAALALLVCPMSAVAQVIPPSAQPGRERERFEVPQAPRAQPSGLAISLPSTTAPPGAEKVTLVVPVQELKPEGASVRIQVIEGYINKVVWPAKLSRFGDFFAEYAAKITAERPANIRTIERYLLL